MKCLFCKADLKEWEKPGQGHLVATKDYESNHLHVHGDITNKDLMKEFIEVTAQETGINLTSQGLSRKEIVFHNRQRIGDMLMFTCGVRDFKKAFPDVRVNVISTAKHIFDHNPYIDRTLVPTEQNTVKIGPGKLTNSSNRLDWHFANAFRVSIEEALGVNIPQGESRPDIWLTQEEWDAPRVIDKPYWLIVVNGEKGWGCKMYPQEKWQEFVNQNKDITFVQLGTNEDNAPRLQGDNVIDYIGKTQSGETGIRDLFKLFLNAEGSIGLVSFHMHLSGALYKPCIVVAGAREPVSFTRFPGHQYLATDGCLPCAVTACWHCDINSCTDLVIKGEEKIPKCVDMITPDDLTRALNSYYTGGRLVKGIPSEKPKRFKNIVKTPEKIIVPEIPPPPKFDIEKYGYTWGLARITEKDWNFIYETLKRENVKSVIEFGSGLSTLLISEICKVTSYEVDEQYIAELKAKKPDLDVRLWDGKALDITEKYDLAFVDGPYSGQNRDISHKIASECADMVITHDAERSFEMLWQDKFLKDKFDGPVKGGHGGSRCHLWKRKKAEITTRAVSPTNNGRKFIKFVSTARGWGGCGRSIATIMKFLLRAGHKVEFIPFRNKVGSRELQAYIKEYLNDLIITENYETVQEKCDIFYIYGDDYIWEFNKPEISDVFSNINADKKIMMLNYRRGGVGEIPWTQGFDKYMFLNSGQEKELLKILPNAKTKVLPPCTELDDFLNTKINYNSSLRIVRHNSQGDTKFSKDCGDEINKALSLREDLEISMMPGPSFVPTNGRFKKYERNRPPIPEFLSMGNLFWYSLPKGYMDMGPRVIIEAMASGLPILADNWGGAPDRVTPECGWICDSKDQMQKVIKNVNYPDLEKMGKCARERAMTFRPEEWIKEITK